MKARFNIIIISTEHFFQNEISLLCKFFLVEQGLLHLRKPHASKEELRNYLLQIPKQFHKKIVIHSHFQLAKEFQLKGVHFTEKIRKSKNIASTLKRKKIKIISSSFHSINEIKRSRREYEYVFLSPIFDSLSKNNYKSGFTLDALKKFLKTNKNNIVALGGINDKNIEKVKKVGFSGAATIGYVWGSKTPVQSYKNLISKIK